MSAELIWEKFETSRFGGLRRSEVVTPQSRAFASARPQFISANSPIPENTRKLKDCARPDAIPETQTFALEMHFRTAFVLQIRAVAASTTVL